MLSKQYNSTIKIIARYEANLKKYIQEMLCFVSMAQYYEYIHNQKITRTLEIETASFGVQPEIHQFEKITNVTSKISIHTIFETVNHDIEELNSTTLTADKLKKIVKQKQTGIIKIVEKELKIVPKNYYRNFWLTVGMSAFGLPIGVAIGLSTHNSRITGDWFTNLHGYRNCDRFSNGQKSF